MINYYGFETQAELYLFTHEVAVAFGKDDEQRITNSNKMMLETMCAETRFGEEEDNTATTGIGIPQFDPIAFVDIQKFSDEYAQLLWNNWKIDFKLLHIEQIRYNGKLAIICMRMKYARVEEAIPSSRDERASYWIDNYNIGGAGTIEHFLSNSKFILGDEIIGFK